MSFYATIARCNALRHTVNLPLIVGHYTGILTSYNHLEVSQAYILRSGNQFGNMRLQGHHPDSYCEGVSRA